MRTSLTARLAVPLSLAVVLASPAAAAPCWPKAEATAQRVLEMQTMLNVAGLQCRYDATLQVLDNYNSFIRQVRPQFMSQLKVLETRFRRTNGRGWQGALDRHRTKIFNSYSTVNDQVPFCVRSSELLREAVTIKPVELPKFADAKMATTNVVLTTCPAPKKKKPARKA